MKPFLKCLLIASGVIVAGLASVGSARADEAAPAVKVMKEQVIVGNPRRPVVTVELTRQRPNLPLHTMTHPLDQHPGAPTP